MPSECTEIWCGVRVNSAMFVKIFILQPLYVCLFLVNSAQLALKVTVYFVVISTIVVGMVLIYLFPFYLFVSNISKDQSFVNTLFQVFFSFIWMNVFNVYYPTFCNFIREGIDAMRKECKPFLYKE
jgi:hypothetical protein